MGDCTLNRRNKQQYLTLGENLKLQYILSIVIDLTVMPLAANQRSTQRYSNASPFSHTSIRKGYRTRYNNIGKFVYSTYIARYISQDNCY